MAAMALGSAAMTYQGQRSANKQNAALSSAQMAFQKEMAINAHQHEVADLKAAGLNPILSGTGGAGAATPGGSMAVMQNELGPAAAAFQQYRIGEAQRKLYQQQEKTTEAQEWVLREDARKRTVETEQATEVLKHLQNINPSLEASARAQAAQGLYNAQIAGMDYATRNRRLKGDLDEADLWSSSAYALKRRADAALETVGKATGGIVGGAIAGAITGRRGKKPLWGGHGSASRYGSGGPMIRRYRREPTLRARPIR